MKEETQLILKHFKKFDSKIDDKIKKIDNRMERLEIKAHTNNENLITHMKRSDYIEKIAIDTTTKAERAEKRSENAEKLSWKTVTFLTILIPIVTEFLQSLKQFMLK